MVGGTSFTTILLLSALFLDCFHSWLLLQHWIHWSRSLLLQLGGSISQVILTGFHICLKYLLYIICENSIQKEKIPKQPLKICTEEQNSYQSLVWSSHLSQWPLHFWTLDRRPWSFQLHQTCDTSPPFLNWNWSGLQLRYAYQKKYIVIYNKLYNTINPFLF